MPAVNATPVRGFASCMNARCPGYEQREVDAVREETSQTYGDNGGDGVMAGMVERSNVRFLFADEAESSCGSCGGPRVVSGDPRPSYQPLSGHDPLGLLEHGPFDSRMVVPPGEDRTGEIQANAAAVKRTEELEAQVAEMREQMAELLKKDK